MRRCARLLPSTAIGLALLAVPAAWATELERNPFRSPLQQEANHAANAGGGDLDSDAVELRGILVAGSHSMVNLGGRIIGIGEEVDGYRLLSVAEEHAVFQHAGETITLHLYPEATE